MSDLFQDGVPEEFIAQRLGNDGADADWHTFQILTKRPENMSRVLDSLSMPVLPNVWLGTSVESSEYVDRIAELQKVRAQVRFVSFEPLLAPVGKIDLSGIHWAIVGGESGPRSRDMQAEWVEEIRRQCRPRGTKFFFKQWGGTNKKSAGRTYRGKTWDAFPTELAAEDRAT